MKKIFSVLFAISVVIGVNADKKYESNWKSLDTRPTPNWFEDAKFGIFIHWGVYSVPAWAPNTDDVYTRYAEWYWHRINEESAVKEDFQKHHRNMYGDKTKYQDFASGFKAEMFDADEWASLFKKAGAKYVVLTSKHHEGFALWPSAQSVNWNSVDVGPHKDICGELSNAVKWAGMKMGFYYSLYEWYNPIYKTNVNQYVDAHMIPQLKDLTVKYRPEIIWTDGEWEHDSKTWKSEEFLSWLYNESVVRKTVVVNDRWGKETRGKHGSFYTTEYDLVHEGDSKDMIFTHPWEECRGIAGSFGYNKAENIEDYSSAKQLIDILIEKVSRGGNLLLNVGPTADGRIPVIMQERLLQMGKWLDVNGEAIYNTRQWLDMPKQNKQQGVYYTVNGSNTYVLLTQPQKQSLNVAGVKDVQKVELLGYSHDIKWVQTNEGVEIEIPSIAVEDSPCEYAWVVKITGREKEAVKRVALDTWYNHEIDDKTGKLHHYTWDDTTFGGFSELGDIFRSQGAILTTINSKPDSKNLKDCNVYIIVDPDNEKDCATPNKMDEGAAVDILSWVENGGRLLVMLNDKENCELSAMNILLNKVGIHANEVSVLTNDLLNRPDSKPVSYDNFALSKFAKHPVFKDARQTIMRGTCTFTLTGNAKQMLTTDEGECVMAEAQYGKGKVIVVADPWIYNEYIGHLLLSDDYNNEDIARNLVNYLVK